jgi:hypothetical protein
MSQKHKHFDNSFQLPLRSVRLQFAVARKVHERFASVGDGLWGEAGLLDAAVRVGISHVC